MSMLRTTWTITHQRPLDTNEDPLLALRHADPDLILWAIEDGQVAATVEILEPPWPNEPT
jgi:hypothetical protein